MPYLDRLRECAYTDPSGTTHKLLFDELTREIPKKVAIFSLPQQDRVETQDLGADGIDYPMDLYITGPDYDTAADAFMAGLALKGPGILSHPRWGDINVQVTGTPVQSESFVDGMGRAMFQVTFKHIEQQAKFPETSVNAESTIKTAADSSASTLVSAFLGPKTANDIAIVSAQAVNFFNKLKNILAASASIDDEVAAALESGLTQAIDAIDSLVDNPTDLAQTVTDLSRIPASTSGSISDKIGAYSTLFNSLTTDYSNGVASNPRFLTTTLSATAIAMSESAAYGTLKNREDAIAASDTVAELLAYYQSVMDEAGPDGDTILQVIDLLTTAQAYLLESSFGLKTARRKILENNSDPLTETFALYGTVEMLDQFCKDNMLQEDEFFLLPMGREVIWYA